MIKGILALFSTGIIFNPMVLLGIFSGFVAIGVLDDEQLKALCTNYHLYLLMLLIAGVYVCFFHRIYRRGGIETNWEQTSISVVVHFLKLVISFIFSMLFITSFTFGGEEEDFNDKEVDRLEREFRLNQNEMQQNYKAIMQNYNSQMEQVSQPFSQQLKQTEGNTAAQPSTDQR